jgi:hypothetical protein
MAKSNEKSPKESSKTDLGKHESKNEEIGKVKNDIEKGSVNLNWDKVNEGYIPKTPLDISKPPTGDED